jgi:ABC-type protease/lipase transport system fused ATPase/permease subunit
MTTTNARRFFAESDFGRALQACKTSFLYAGFFSLFVNVLLLVPSFYMLAVYDKVMVSGSESTLLMLSLITLFLFLVMGGLEWIRSQILIATSSRLWIGAGTADGFVWLTAQPSPCRIPKTIRPFIRNKTLKNPDWGFLFAA